MPVDTEWLFSSFPRAFFSRDVASASSVFEVFVIEEDNVTAGDSDGKFLSADNIALVASDKASFACEATTAVLLTVSAGGTSSVAIASVNYKFSS